MKRRTLGFDATGAVLRGAARLVGLRGGISLFLLAAEMSEGAIAPDCSVRAAAGADIKAAAINAAQAGTKTGDILIL